GGRDRRDGAAVAEEGALLLGGHTAEHQIRDLRADAGVAERIAHELIQRDVDGRAVPHPGEPARRRVAVGGAMARELLDQDQVALERRKRLGHLAETDARVRRTARGPHRGLRAVGEEDEQVLRLAGLSLGGLVVQEGDERREESGEAEVPGEVSSSEVSHGGLRLYVSCRLLILNAAREVGGMEDARQDALER